MHPIDQVWVRSRTVRLTKQPSGVLRKLIQRRGASGDYHHQGDHHLLPWFTCLDLTPLWHQVCLVIWDRGGPAVRHPEPICSQKSDFKDLSYTIDWFDIIDGRNIISAFLIQTLTVFDDCEGLTQTSWYSVCPKFKIHLC